jgi:hypothetical protein
VMAGNQPLRQPVEGGESGLQRANSIIHVTSPY